MAREVLETSNDIAKDVYEIIDLYSSEKEICRGLNFDFSNFFLYGIPELWQIYTLANAGQQKELITAMK